MASDVGEATTKDRGGRTAEPERTCIVTCRTGTPADLIRFVLSPDGVVTPDLAHRLPGRGAWVTAERPDVEAAVAKKAFAKSFRRQVKVPDDLGGLIDRLLTQRLTEAVALANKAGLVSSGFTRVEAAILTGDVRVVLHGRDGAEDGAKKLDRLYAAVMREIGFRAGNAPVIVRLLDIMQISLAIGRSNVVHAAMTHGGAAERFVQEAHRLARYRRSPADVIITAAPEPETPDGENSGRPTGNE